MTTETNQPTGNGGGWLVWIGVAFFVRLLLVGVGVIGDGFKWISGGAEGAEKIFAFASNPIVGVILGTLATALVQSSSTVTSVIVGLVAGGVPVSIAIPMIMGANIGTCITALLAATAVTGEYELVALQIALVHLLYNVFGVLLFLYIPLLKDTPIKSAQWLGNKTETNRAWAFGYILGVFFMLPGIVFGGQAIMQNTEPEVHEPEAHEELLDRVEGAVQREEMAIE